MIEGVMKWVEPNTSLDCAIKASGSTEEIVNQNLLAIAEAFGYDASWPTTVSLASSKSRT
jgi:hypothetical protein